MSQTQQAGEIRRSQFPINIKLKWRTWYRIMHLAMKRGVEMDIIIDEVLAEGLPRVEEQLAKKQTH